MTPKRTDHRGNAQKRATNFDIITGRKIQAARKRARLSQTALAEAAGVTFQQIQKYERGENRVTLERFTRMVRAMGESATEMLGDIIHESEAQ